MEQRDLKTVKSISLFFVPVLLGYICHILSRQLSVYFLGVFLNLLRTAVYIGLFSAWGMSVKRRIMQTKIRRYLLTVAGLIVFWLTAKELKYRFLINPVLLRRVWYLYYIPVILIPLLALFVSISLSKSANYKVPKPIKLLLVPAAVLIAAVLTNDSHFYTFSFPYELSSWREDSAYSYGPVFFIIVAWVLILSFISIIIMFIKSREPRRKSKIILPALLPVAVVGYLVLYVIKKPLLTALCLDDIALIESLAFMSFFEICVRFGLIQSNSRYFDLFKGSVDTAVQILDNDYKSVYRAGNSENFAEATLKKACSSSPMIEDGKRIYSMKIKGGYALWSEDISELLKKSEMLYDTHEELTERNALLEYEYKREHEHKSVEEQNRLYDLLQSKTQKQTQKIYSLVSEYRTAVSKDEKREILRKIAVIGSYVKRRKDFVLYLSSSSDMPSSRLESAFSESYNALSLSGIGGSYLVLPEEICNGESLARAYDFFEEILENVLKNIHFINTSVTKIQGRLRASVLVDCTVDEDRIRQSFPTASVFSEDGETRLLLELE